MHQKVTISLDMETIKRLEEASNSLHLSKSGFLRFLIWSYKVNKPQNEVEQFVR